MVVMANTVHGHAVPYSVSCVLVLCVVARHYEHAHSWYHGLHETRYWFEYLEW